MRTGLPSCLLAVALAPAIGWAAARGGASQAPVSLKPRLLASTYRGWNSLWLSNGLINLQVVPKVGGRVMQFSLAGKELFWVNPQLAGKAPPPGGLGPEGAWLNYGGDKIWPAPQGWDGDAQWPGPPDAVLDGSPYTSDTDSAAAAVSLTSGDDPRTGLRLARTIRIFEGTTRVSIDATMTNIDQKLRRWGLWGHTQLDAAKVGGKGHNPLLSAWCPANPKSRFPTGYCTLFGAADNPSFRLDPEKQLVQVQYRYQVGKIGVDSPAGWVATVNGANGLVFVQRFAFDAAKEYPDGSSVEFWLNGVGRIHAYKRDIEMPSDPAQNPYVFESEVLSPFAALQPGESFTWHYDWYVTNIGGIYPVVDCTDAGVVAAPLAAVGAAGKLMLTGRFGVFAAGRVQAVFLDARGKSISTRDLEASASPTRPVIVGCAVDLPDKAVALEVVLLDPAGKTIGPLGRATFPPAEKSTAPDKDNER